MTPFPNGWPVPKNNFYSPYELHTSCGLFTSDRTNDSLYDCLPVRMTPRTNDSTLPIFLHSSSVNKLMTWSRTHYLCSLRTDDLFPDRIFILRMNGWPSFPNGWPVPKHNIYSPYELLRVLMSNKNICMFLVSRNGKNIIIWSWNKAEDEPIGLEKNMLKTNPSRITKYTVYWM